MTSIWVKKPQKKYQQSSLSNFYLFSILITNYYLEKAPKAYFKINSFLRIRQITKPKFGKVLKLAEPNGLQ